MKIFTILFLVIAGTTIGHSQSVRWLTIDSVQRAANGERPILIDFYTSWCYYCRVMDTVTWNNSGVANYVNNAFVSTKFNGESRDSVSWQGKDYGYVAKYKTHQLTIDLLKGNIIYPSTLIIAANGDVEHIRGYKRPEDVEIILKYYGSRSNERMSFETFQKSFSGEWRLK